MGDATGRGSEVGAENRRDGPDTRSGGTPAVESKPSQPKEKRAQENQDVARRPAVPVDTRHGRNTSRTRADGISDWASRRWNIGLLKAECPGAPPDLLSSVRFPCVMLKENRKGSILSRRD